MATNATHGPVDVLVGRVAERAAARQLTIAVAESLTGGQLATALAAGKGSGSWFRGSVVAYHPEVKFAVLGVTPGPVVTARTAREMAQGAARLLGADLAVSVTGVGGPGPEEGQPAGTVFLCTAGPDFEAEVSEQHFPGDPIDVLHATIRCALASLVARLEA
ncbi:nicotinamide-nucleotide amidase [Mycolicibacterium mucogenicum 261Sha1.1M5]|nr:nicotinamide-nucleotide amidase [Mycolicibacterium mucogenicum 261Sha1.1M5]